MPIKIPDNLPAVKTLASENIFVMTNRRAVSQDIRPLKILLLNLMPNKIETETQLSRLLGNSPLQVDLTLIHTKSHVSKNTSDGMIITGAPVEQMEFEDVEYYPELCEIMEWTKSHVHSTFHICWGAQAGLYYHYGIKKYPVENKIFGVFKHKVTYKNSILFRGFDDSFMVPQSRHTTVKKEEIKAVKELKILAESDETGVYAVSSKNGKQIFITGHSEYDANTLKNEYFRDLNANKPIEIPKNYFPGNNPQNEPEVTWRAHANLLYSNWLNYFVYQTTPYDVEKINK